MALDILYPNGQVEAVQVYIWSGTEPILWDGSVTAVVSVGAVDQGAAGTDPWLVLESNSAAILAATQAIVTALGSGIVVTATNLDIRDLAFSTDKVDVSGSTGVGVTGSFLTDTQLRATPVPVSGTVTVDTSLLATAAKQDIGNASLAQIDTNTDPFLVSNAGGYVRQDSTATIAKESGGNLATLAGIVTSARGAVNLIVGQAGVDGNTGTTGATTQRVVLATDTTVPNVTGNIANDNADSGNPVKVGGKAITSFPTAVAAADRTDFNTDTYGRQLTRNGHESLAGNTWTAIHVPAANNQATATKASAGTGIRNVCTGFTVSLASSSTSAPAAIQLTVNVIDGASGGGTYLWRSVISLPATAGAMSAIVRSNLWLTGTAATALTIEFSAAGGANTIESVSMEGTVVTE